MTKGKKHLRDCLGERLRKRFEYIATNAEATCQEFQKGNNIQGHEHCEAVEKNLDLLIPDLKKEGGLNETEIFVLLAAAHLHDIGKVEESNHFGWKSEHGNRGMEIINENYDKLGLDRIQAAAVGFIVGVHGDGRLDQLPLKPMLVGTDEVHLIEIASVFRLADMLDTTYQRVPELVSRILFSDGNVPDKWLARQTISGWTLDERNRVVLQAIPATDEVRVAYALKDMMNEDLAKIAPHLRLAGYPWELSELDVGSVRLTSYLRQRVNRDRPFPGMAYYEEDQASIFRGREEEIERLLSAVSNSPIVLLIGESGAGKTSLIHAGLFPRLRAMMWECVWTRPLGNPRVAIRDLIWRATLEGPIKAESSLWEVMKLTAEKCRPRNVLIAMDQFEDVLNSPQLVLEELTKDLVTVQARSVMPNLRVLVSFREDAIVRLSTRLLKAITGSAQQFPSVELERLSHNGAKESFLAGMENARIGLDPRQEVGQRPLIEIILSDIQQTDDRLYPPYLQMVAETLCTKVEKDSPIISREMYHQSGGANDIIAHYLIRRLDEFGPKKDKARNVLVSLTSSDGKKAQMTVSALRQATGIETDEIKEILEKMIDLRMARKIDNDEYEIIHDHLGRLVDKELVVKEDRELKFLQEQLEAAQRLYEVHREPMIRSSTLWASLYRNRKRLVISQDKYSLLLCSYLWNTPSELADFDMDSFMTANSGRNSIQCGWFWLKNLSHPSMFALSIDLIKHEENMISNPASELLVDLVTHEDLSFITKILKDENKHVRQAALKAIGKVGTRDDLSLINDSLKDKDIHQAAVEAFCKLCTHDDLSLIIDFFKDGVSGVRQAAVETFGKLCTHEDLSLIVDMLKDVSWSIRQLVIDIFGKLGSHDDLSLIIDMLKDTDEDVRQAAVKVIGKFGTHDDLSLLYPMLKGKNEVVRPAVVETIGKLGTHDDLRCMINLLKDDIDVVREAALNAIGSLVIHDDLSFIIDLLKNKDNNFRKAAVTAIRKVGTHDDLSLIIDMLKDTDEDVRQAAVEALGELGSHDDLSLILDMLNDTDWNVRQAAVEALGDLGTHDDLSLIIDMFKDADEDVRQAAAEALSKLGTHDDLSLIIALLKADKDSNVRQAAVKVFDKLGTREDRSLILDMLKDDSWNVRQETLEIFGKFSTHDDLSLFVDMLKDTDEDVRQAAAEALVNIAVDLDADGLLDLLAERAQGWDSVAHSYYKALCILDRKFYCPFPLDSKKRFDGT